MSDAGAVGRLGTSDIVGREAEQARIDVFREGFPAGARALAIRGEPGIGKTTLWRQAVEECRRAGTRVLVARPAEEKRFLAHGGLVDLFEDVEPAAFEGDDDPVVRGHAVLAALRQVVESAPALLAIDDLQWLDSASARVLRYAVRRLDAEPLGVLTTARTGSEPADPLALARLLPPGRAETLSLSPLGLTALRGVLAGAVSAISRPALRRIYEVSEGNPLFALELARSLGTDDGRGRSSPALRLPDSLQEAIVERLETVPGDLVPLLEATSALGRTSVPELRETLPDADVERLLPIAVEHGLLVLSDALEVRFSHPLVSSVVYGRVSPLARRSLHARLAERARDPDLRARHLALSTDEADARVAQELEASALRAAARGAPDLAAELIGHSLRLTPAGDTEATRRRALAEIAHTASAGEIGKALELADRQVAGLAPGPGRAEALVQRAQTGARGSRGGRGAPRAGARGCGRRGVAQGPRARPARLAPRHLPRRPRGRRRVRPRGPGDRGGRRRAGVRDVGRGGTLEHGDACRQAPAGPDGQGRGTRGRDRKACPVGRPARAARRAAALGRRPARGPRPPAGGGCRRRANRQRALAALRSLRPRRCRVRGREPRRGGRAPPPGHGGRA